jgi:hypothetical protein
MRAIASSTACSGLMTWAAIPPHARPIPVDVPRQQESLGEASNHRLGLAVQEERLYIARDMIIIV